MTAPAVKHSAPKLRTNIHTTSRTNTTVLCRHGSGYEVAVQGWLGVRSVAAPGKSRGPE